jgi:hypothetical protein
MTVAQMDGVDSKAQKAIPAPVLAVEEEEEEEEAAPVEEPTKRKSKKEEAPAPKKDLNSLLDEWDDE